MMGLVGIVGIMIITSLVTLQLAQAFISQNNSEPETTFTDCIFAFMKEYGRINNITTYTPVPGSGDICQMYYDQHGRYPNYNDLFSGDKSMFGRILSIK